MTTLNSITVKIRLILLILYTLFIYSTLPLARDITNFLRERNLLRAFVAGISILTILLGGLYLFKRKGKTSLKDKIALFLVGPTVLLLIFLIETPEERLHIVQYGLLGVISVFYFSSFQKGFRSYLFSFLMSGSLGYLDEVIQYFLPSRIFDWRDVGFNLVGSAVGVLIYYFGSYHKEGNTDSIPNT